MKRIDLKALFEITLSPLPYLFVFLGSIKQPLDADLGWHLKYGEYFYKHLTPLRENPYSSMMPNFHWPNSSWVTDVVSYSAYYMYGFTGLSILGALSVTLTFFFISKAFKLTFLQKAILFPILLYLESPVNDVSFRGQQLSLLFLSILLFLLETSNKKIFNTNISRAFLIPVLFLIWVNVHGEFLLGFGIMGIWIVGKAISELIESQKGFAVTNFVEVAKKMRQLLILLTISVAVTFINPFGISLYQEALTHIGNPNLKYVMEYLPFKELSTDWRNLFIMASLLLFGACMFFLNGQLTKRLPIILIATTLFILTLSVMRFAWPFYYITPGILVAYFAFDDEKYMWSKITGGIILTVAIGIIILFYNPFKSLPNYNWFTYCASYIDCSPESAKFLEKAQIKGEILSNYNWGGWLIWNYPKIKPSIDGRMHLWRDETGYSAFDEYYALEQNIKDIDVSRFNTVYAWRGKRIFKRLIQLANEKRWKILYLDDIAIIAVRITPYSSTKLIQ